MGVFTIHPRRLRLANKTRERRINPEVNCKQPLFCLTIDAQYRCRLGLGPTKSQNVELMLCQGPTYIFVLF
jgi:hypothetical protein